MHYFFFALCLLFSDQAISLEPAHPASWAVYFDAAKNSPPRETAVIAANYFNEHNIHPEIIVDLGCGAGRETMFILDKGWRVLAIDKSEEGLSRLKARLTPEQATRVTIQAASFETLTLPPEIDWINASFSLPYCHPDHFNKLWDHLVASIKPGGILSGQFFGDRDTWKDDAHITTLSLETVQHLLASFDLLSFQERERDGPTASGIYKHWHVFNFVARKKEPEKKDL